MRDRSPAMSKVTAVCAVALLVPLLATRLVAADVSARDAARAERLFEAGHKLIEAGHVDLACESFAASFAIDPQQGTRLNLADCRERQGRLVEAYELFAIGVGEAARANKPRRLTFARQRTAALAQRLVEVKLRVPAIAGLEVKVNGRGVPREEWGRVLRREPSKLVVEASAPGRASYRAEVVGTAGSRVVIAIPMLAPLEGDRRTRAALVGHGVADAARDASSSGGRRSAPLIVGGAGGVLVVGGIVLGLHARARYLDELASPAPDLNRRLDGPQRDANIATVMGLAGTAAIATGVVMYVRGRRDRVVVTPTADSTGAGLSITGGF
jgi:hypothetical protein